ncbi:MAG: hypothetical protein GY928_27775, partial [Colwellia sp.]|nr:hypothetical protein [Colwellia sp.]
ERPSDNQSINELLEQMKRACAGNKDFEMMDLGHKIAQILCYDTKQKVIGKFEDFKQEKLKEMSEEKINSQ